MKLRWILPSAHLQPQISKSFLLPKSAQLSVHIHYIYLLNCQIRKKIAYTHLSMKIPKGERLDILFSSNDNIHKSSCGLCFWGCRPFNWWILLKSNDWRVCSLKTWATQTFMNVVVLRKSRSRIGKSNIVIYYGLL